MSIFGNIKTRVRNYLIFVFVMAMGVVPAFAQDTTINVDTTSLFDQINQWITALFPVLSIGFAIAIAIAIISFIGRSIMKAFSGAA